MNEGVNQDVLRMKRHMLGVHYIPTLEELEYALDHHQLWAKMNNGNFWVCRRNGKTQRWKRDLKRSYPARFRLPIKFGLKGNGAIINLNLDNSYLISEENPNKRVS